MKRAYFYAKATRDIYVDNPDDDYEEGDEVCVGKLNLNLYGTRDAAMDWSNRYTKLLQRIGLIQGKSSPCNFHHPDKNIVTNVHGYESTSTNRRYDLEWLDRKVQEPVEIKTNYSSPTKDHDQEIRILTRIVAWTTGGITYAADPRHAE